MQGYDLVVTGHVMSAVTWVGASTLTSFTGRRAEKNDDPKAIKFFLDDISYLAPRFFIPISLLTVAFGFWAVAIGPYGFGDAWVDSGLAMFVVSFLVGAAFLGPQTDKALEEFESGGRSAAVDSRFARIKHAHDFETLLLYAIIFMMVVKPT